MMALSIRFVTVVLLAILAQQSRPTVGTVGIADGPSGMPARTDHAFTSAVAGEATAVVRASCARCSWRESGREAAVLRVVVDGVYSQHLVLVRGEDDADYRIALGRLPAGTHRISLSRDPALSAAAAGAVTVSAVDVSFARAGTDDEVALSMTPVLYARANTVGRFTDLPVLMWYEVVPTVRGRQFRYSVIFTNEDGGTETDRLMATWGRTTDIEYVYGAELDGSGRVVSEEIQAAGHKYPPFDGRHEGRHPLLWVDTDNNMVAARGTTTVRYRPAAERFDLSGTSREAVMDAHPWSYRIAADEMVREGKIQEEAVAGSGMIPDPRRFTFVEACTELVNAAVAFSVRASDGNGGGRWFESDRGVPEFRVARSGCFRGGVPVPSDPAGPSALRFRAFSRREKGSSAEPEVTLIRVNRVFTLGPDYAPRPMIVLWSGSIALPIDGDWRELPLR